MSETPPTAVEHPATPAAGAQRSTSRPIDTFILIVAWALVVFVVQECTTGSNYPLPTVKAIGSRVVRFALDLLACGTVVLLARGRLVYLAPIGWAMAALVSVVYFDYFDKTLSWTTIKNQYAEGLAVGGYAVALIRWQSLSLIVGATIGLSALARRMNRKPLPCKRRIRLAVLGGTGWLMLAIISTQFIDKVNKLRTFGNVDRLAMTNGYFLTWLGEWWYLDGDALLLRAQEAAQFKQNRLAPLEAPPPPLGERLVIVQVESLDFDVLACQVGGRRVTPFLSGLSERSMFFRIAAIHESGSCDADFVMLMDLFPAGDVAPYTVPGFDWAPSLADHARARGYQSVFFHGNDRSFFNRGPAVDAMGFDRVLFREELESQLGLKSKHWGVSDKDVFDASRDLLMAEPGRVLHFIITLTSHGPFNFLDSQDRELFSEPTTKRENYLNSMRYVDTQLESYVSSLPAGTVVVLYGDHTSHVDYGQEPSPAGLEFVPFIVHEVGGDLSRSQQTRDQEIAHSGELTLLDAAGFVWSLFGSVTEP